MTLPNKKHGGAKVLVRPGERGMTLLEILVVMAIIATITGVLFGPAIQDALFSSKESNSRLKVMQLANNGYGQWSLKTGKTCPDSLLALAKYTTAFGGETEVLDEWDQEILMVCGGKGGTLPEGVRFGVQSIGEDGKRDTKDDIKSWEKKKKSEE